jgi:hypothetical protein
MSDAPSRCRPNATPSRTRHLGSEASFRNVTITLGFPSAASLPNPTAAQNARNSSRDPTGARSGVNETNRSNCFRVPTWAIA